MLLAGMMNDHIIKMGTVRKPESILQILHDLAYLVAILIFLFDTFS